MDSESIDGGSNPPGATTPSTCIGMLLVRRAKPSDFPLIVELQKRNLFQNVSETQKESGGFVSVETSSALLAEISEKLGITVAEDGLRVVGYEFPLTAEMARRIPVLVPLVDRLSKLSYGGKRLFDYKLILEGQICLADEHKGSGLAEKMHSEFVKMLSAKFDLVATEVSSKNPRSLEFHVKKLGFDVVEEYEAEGRRWFVLASKI